MSWLISALWKRVMIGLVLGALVGFAMRGLIGGETAASVSETWIYPFGKAFVALIQMLIVPLIFTTLVSGVTAMGDPAKLGTLGVKTIATYLLTTAFAVTIGLVVATFIRPGGHFTLEDFGASPEHGVVETLQIAQNAGGFSDRLLAIIPTNPVSALAEGNILSIILFAILFGVACLLAGQKGRSITEAIDSAADAMLRMTGMVMELAPFGVFALITWVCASKGFEPFAAIGLLVLSVYLACAIQIALVYGGIIRSLGLPISRFFLDITDAQAIAFSTASSNATLPVTIATAHKNLGIEKSVASSVLPLGATINMDGTAIYLGVVAVFAAQALGIDMPLSTYVLVALTATLSSIGAAGIPSAGLLLAASVLSVVGVDEAAAVAIIAFIFPFDRVLDMMRTMTNVTGDIAVASAVARWQDDLDCVVFKARPVV